jgi:hypothetical protein
LHRARYLKATSLSYYCLVQDFAEKGDVIRILSGGKTPFCLRPKNKRYLLLGERYVHGLMDGEAIDVPERGELDRRTFEIK